jgi:hypothetical protein
MFCSSCEKGIDDLVQDVLDQWTRQAEIICECWESLVDGQGNPYASESTCVSDFGAPLPSQRECIESALKQDEPASKEYLNCYLPLEEDLADCFDERLTCSDPTPVTSCFDDYDIGADQCDPLPADVDRALENCFPDEASIAPDKRLIPRAAPPRMTRARSGRRP